MNDDNYIGDEELKNSSIDDCDWEEMKKSDPNLSEQ